MLKVFMKKKVLFVCTGNTCRSPLAEVWFNKCAADRGAMDLSACSAGICAVNGEEASYHSRCVADENNLDLEGFRSQMLTRELLKTADLIVGMTDGHCRRIVAFAPDAAAKTHRLLEFADGGEVSDPYGGTLADYRRCFESMRKAVEKLVDEIINSNI